LGCTPYADEHSNDTRVGPIQLKEYLKPNKWALESGIHLEAMENYKEVWMLLEAPTNPSVPLRQLGPKSMAVDRGSIETVERDWVTSLESRIEILKHIGTSAIAQTNV